MYELREAFREAARREFAMVPAETELDYVFSNRFEQRMRRMIRAEAHGYWNLINTTAKRVAIAAAIILMLLSTAMAIKPVRERVIKFFVEVYEDYFEIRFGEEEKDDIDPTPQSMVRYTLTKLPEGYEEVRFEQFEHILWTHWRNLEGNDISLKQEPGTNEIIVDDSGSKIVEIKHEDLEIVYHQYKETSVFVWEQDEYVFKLTTYSSFEIEEVLTLIASLKKY